MSSACEHCEPSKSGCLKRLIFVDHGSCVQQVRSKVCFLWLFSKPISSFQLRPLSLPSIVHVSLQLRMIWAHRCADAGVRCHDCPTNTPCKQCVVLMAKSSQIMLSWMEYNGCITLVSAMFEVSAYDTCPLLSWSSSCHTCIDC